MFEALVSYQFLRHAVLASLMASVVCGVIGVIIVEKKLVMMSGGIAHTAYGGVGLGYLCGFSPMLGAALFSVTAAVGIGYVRRSGKMKSDVAIALFWSLGMALGVLFVSLMPGYPPDLSSYLFGNILSVVTADLYLMLVLSFVVLATVFLLFQDWKTYLFDEEFAYVSGLNTRFLEYALQILIALSVVVLIRLVGIIMVIALLSAPAATAALFTRRLASRMLAAMGFCLAYCFAGLALSYTLDLSSGATIVIVAVVCYFVLSLFRNRIVPRIRQAQGTR
jgi:zinc transport system permease protein